MFDVPVEAPVMSQSVALKFAASIVQWAEAGELALDLVKCRLSQAIQAVSTSIFRLMPASPISGLLPEP